MPEVTREEMRLVDVAEVITDPPPQYSGVRSYISTGALVVDRIDESAVEQVEYESRPSRANLYPAIGDVLFAKMQATRKTLVITDESFGSIFSTGFYALRPNKDLVDVKLLAHYLNSPTFLIAKDAECRGGTQKALNGSGLKNLYIKLPHLDVQVKMVQVLDVICALKKNAEERLELLDRLGESRFVEMFGDPTRADREWPTATLPELGELNRGVSKARPRNSPDLLGGPYPLIQTGDVSNAQLWIKEFTSTYSEKGLAQSRLWEKGTLCITIAANIAQTAILGFDACFPDSVVGFVPNERTNAIFVHYWFSFFQRILEAQAPQVAQKNINLRVLSELCVIEPPIELQCKFAAFVAEVDKAREAVRQTVEQLDQLYRAKLQEYFG